MAVCQWEEAPNGGTGVHYTAGGSPEDAMFFTNGFNPIKQGPYALNSLSIFYPTDYLRNSVINFIFDKSIQVHYS